jgi:hypothetical protein
MALSEKEKKYRNSPRGYLNRIYNGVKTRCTNTKNKRTKSYHGLDFMTWEEFLEWGFTEELVAMHKNYLDSGKDRKLAPSVDRIDPTKGYVKGNVQWLTLSENSRRAGKPSHIPIFCFGLFLKKY